MAMKADTPRFTATYVSAAKWLHWILALLIPTMIVIGLYMTSLPEGPLQDKLFENHEAVGFIILWLVVARIVVRWTNTPPAPAPTLTPFEKYASGAAHYLMYVLILAMPILGWAGNSAYGSNISVFGLFEIPAILPKNQALSDGLFVAHKFGGIFLGLIIIAHVSGALMHLVVKRDRVFQRMWFGRV